MQTKQPGLLQMMRAPFFSSILTPLIAGTLLAVHLQGEFNPLRLVLVLIMGMGLHAATNVYNDIYDTIQGTDKINVHRNEFSGGSGILVADPNLMPKMYRIAQVALILAFLATLGLTFLVKRWLWPHLWVLFLLSAFFSKFYTAAPIKLAYRGLGEISVWFAFGPMAILVAAVSQNVGFHPTIIASMPMTGISTLSILLVGQMIDVDADKTAGKLGIAARWGNKPTRTVYFIVQTILMLNLLLLGVWIIPGGWPLLIGLVPYVVIFPRIVTILSQRIQEPDALKLSAGLNVKLHLLFSLGLIVGLGTLLIL